MPSPGCVSTRRSGAAAAGGRAPAPEATPASVAAAWAARGPPAAAAAGGCGAEVGGASGTLHAAAAAASAACPNCPLYRRAREAAREPLGEAPAMRGSVLLARYFSCTKQSSRQLAARRATPCREHNADGALVAHKREAGVVATHPQRVCCAWAAAVRPRHRAHRPVRRRRCFAAPAVAGWGHPRHRRRRQPLPTRQQLPLRFEDLLQAVRPGAGRQTQRARLRPLVGRQGSETWRRSPAASRRAADSCQMAPTPAAPARLSARGRGQARQRRHCFLPRLLQRRLAPAGSRARQRCYPLPCQMRCSRRSAYAVARLLQQCAHLPLGWHWLHGRGNATWRPRPAS